MNRNKLLALAAMLLVPLAACDEGTPPVPVGSIDGQVSIEGQGIDGVTVTLSTGTSTSTAGGGRFSFAGIDGGTYTVTISNFPADASFSSTSQPATITTDGQAATVNFSGTYIRTASIIGSVTVEGEGISGVTVRISGIADQATQTDANGQYAFAQLRAGRYTVEVSDFGADVGFSSPSQSVTLGVGETGAASFDGTYVRTAGIIGRVSIEGNGLAGVTVSLSGIESRTATTDAAGQYAFAELRAGDYTVGISGYDADDHGFTETSRSVTVALGQTENVPFDGIRLRTASIMGKVAVEGTGLAGVTVNLSGAESRSATTNDMGMYVFTELRAGDYMVNISGYDAEEHEFDQTSWSGSVALGQTVNVPFDGTRLRTAGISGQVSVGGEGIAGVMVSLAGPTSMMDTTNNAGQYAFSGLAAGTYTVTISGYDMMAYVFEATTKTVELMDDQAAIENFMGAHATTASISGQLYLDANMNNAFEMADEDPFNFAELTVSLLGPGVADSNTAMTDDEGMFMFEGLRAGTYRVFLRSADVEKALMDEDWPEGVMFGGDAEGYTISLTPGGAMKQDIPFDITMQTLTIQAMMGNGEGKTGAMVEGVGIDLYPTYNAANANRNQIGDMAMTDSTGTAMFKFMRSQDTSPGGGADYVVFAKVAELPHDDLTVVNNEVIEITYSPRTLSDEAADAVEMLNHRATFRYWVKNIETEAGGGEAQEGWQTEVRTHPSLSGFQAPKASDKRGMVSHTDMVDITDLPAMFYVRLAVEGQGMAHNEEYMGTPDPSEDASMESAKVGDEKGESNLLAYQFDGLTMPGDTTDLGAIMLEFTTQTLKVGVHYERDHIPGFDNQNFQSRDARANAARTSIKIRLMTQDEYGTLRNWEYPDDSPSSLTTTMPRSPGVDGIVNFNKLPAKTAFVVSADVDDRDVHQIYGHRDLDTFMGSRRATISRGMYSVGSFGEDGGTGPVVNICPLALKSGIENCSTFGFGYKNNVVTGTIVPLTDRSVSALPNKDTLRVTLKALAGGGSGSSTVKVYDMADDDATEDDMGATVNVWFFNNVADGRYEVSVPRSDRGYWRWPTGTDTITVTANDGDGTGESVSVVDSGVGGTTMNITYLKTSIAGTVANYTNDDLSATAGSAPFTVQSSQTVEGAVLTLYKVPTTGKAMAVGTTKTDSRGTFEFDDLEEGTYYVQGDTTSTTYDLRATNTRPINKSPNLITTAMTTSYTSGNSLPRWSYGDTDGTATTSATAQIVLDTETDADFVVLFKDGEVNGTVTRLGTTASTATDTIGFRGVPVVLQRCGDIPDITGNFTPCPRSGIDPAFTPRRMLAGADGGYRFTGLREGVYHVVLDLSGYNYTTGDSQLTALSKVLDGPRDRETFTALHVATQN